MSVLSTEIQKQVEEKLIAEGLLTTEQLQALRTKAEKDNLPFFGVLISDGHVSNEQLTKTIAQVTNVPYVNLSGVKIDADILALLPRDIAERYMAVPLGQAEAARALGLNFMQAATQIILPQAFRGSVAPLGNTLIALLKNSTVAAAASVATETSTMMSEMIEYHADQIVPIFLIFAFGYVVLIIPIGMLTTYLSNKLAVRR